MQWTRTAENMIESDAGHRVTRVRAGDSVRYVAWGPDSAIGWDHRQWANGGCEHWSGTEPKVHYGIGEKIPQGRELIGVCDSAAEAKGLCVDTGL